MSAQNRYYFTKEVHPEYLILLYHKNKYYSYGKDRKILEYINFNNKLYILRKKRINYLILDELDIIEKKEYVDNQLSKYLYLTYFKSLFDRFKVVMSSKYDL